jgi:hypothetical protein
MKTVKILRLILLLASCAMFGLVVWGVLNKFSDREKWVYFAAIFTVWFFYSLKYQIKRLK